MAIQNYYTILGISPAASQAQIRAAYRKLAFLYHPDRNPGKPEAEEKFKMIAEAYQVLEDSSSRARYDRLLAGLVQPAVAVQRPDGRKKSKAKSREQLEEEHKKDYEQRVATWSYTQRIGLAGLLAYAGWLLVFRNWYMDVQSADPAYIFAGVVVYIWAILMFSNEYYLQLHYQKLKVGLGFNFEKRAMMVFLLLLLGGFVSVFIAGYWRKEYHLAHYPLFARARVEREKMNDHDLNFVFKTPEGQRVHKWMSCSPEQAALLDDTDSIEVIYSSEDPRICEPNWP